MKPKDHVTLVDCFGWPLPPPNGNIKLKDLVERIKTAVAQLESRAISGDSETMREFEQLLSVFGDKHQHFLRDRAKAGDKSFHGQSSIEKLLWTADDTAECLAWLAKNHSIDCERHAECRLNWPGFISLLPSIESKSQALKACIPLGRKFEHYNKKRTQADMLFRIARYAISYFSDHPSFNSYSSFYFTPDIKDVEWMKRQDAHEAIKKHCARLGAISRDNWPNWKPIFARFITLHYGPSHERWKLIPDTPMPQELKLAESKRKIGRPDLEPKSWKDNLYIARKFGTAAEWYGQFGKALELTPTERDELKKEIEQFAAGKAESCVNVMDIEGDASLVRLRKRANSRNAKWGDYKNEILRRCQHLLPKC